MNNREIYRKQMEAQLDEFQAAIDMMKAKAKKAGVSAIKSVDHLIDEAEEKKSLAEKKLHKLKDASEDSWEALKGDASDAIDELKKKIDSLGQNFVNK
jgi:ElaB/YqjD/DUF883 family membrane-anchored ribosome-binding protein